jgi:hypothetical protein
LPFVFPDDTAGTLWLPLSLLPFWVLVPELFEVLFELLEPQPAKAVVMSKVVIKRPINLDRFIFHSPLVQV